MKVGLLEVSLMNFILGICKEIKIEVEGDVTRNIIDELHCRNIQGDQNEGVSGVTRRIIDELHSLDIQGDETEGEGGVTRNNIDELHSSYIQGDQKED